MDYDAKSVGQSLQQVPVGDMIQSYAKGIADAQWALDEKSIEMAGKLLTAKVTLPDASGKPRERSLLELGFTPTFYQFQEATIEIAVSLTMKVEQSVSVGVHVGFNENSKNENSKKEAPKEEEEPKNESSGNEKNPE